MGAARCGPDTDDLVGCREFVLDGHGFGLLWLNNREGHGQMPGHDGVSAVGKMTEVTGPRGGVQMARIAP